MTEVITVLRSFAIVISASMKSLAGLILRQTVAGQAGSRRHPFVQLVPGGKWGSMGWGSQSQLGDAKQGVSNSPAHPSREKDLGA